MIWKAVLSDMSSGTCRNTCARSVVASIATGAKLAGMRRAALWTLTLSLLACDPGAAPADAGKPGSKSADKAADRADGKYAPEVLEVRNNVSGDRAGLADCLGGCATDSKLSATDRETCRLNCKQSFPVTEAMGAVDKVREAQLAGFADCAGACSGAERATCLNACKDASPELRPVADSLAACVDGCATAAGQSDTDRATCKLNCRAAAGSTLAPPK